MTSPADGTAGALAGRLDPLIAARLPLVADLPARALAELDQVSVAALAQFARPYGAPVTGAVRVSQIEARCDEGPHRRGADGHAVPLRVYRPAEAGRAGSAGSAGRAGRETAGLAPTRPALVWMHGGAFVRGDLDMPESDQVARALALIAGAVVVSVDYRLAVGGVCFPAPHHDALTAIGWTRRHAAALDVDRRRIAIGGASSGGALAAGAALALADAGSPPWRAILAYPVCHPAPPPPSPALAAQLEQLPPSRRFPPAMLRQASEAYLGGPVETATPYAFPALAQDLSGFPPTFLELSELDDLRPSGEGFAAGLRAAGVTTRVALAAGMPHGHLNLIGHPATVAAYHRLAAALADGLPPGPDRALRPGRSGPPQGR